MQDINARYMITARLLVLLGVMLGLLSAAAAFILLERSTENASGATPMFYVTLALAAVAVLLVGVQVAQMREWKRMRRQLVEAQKMETVGRMAGGIAHDFNNILATIMGYGHFLDEDLDGEPELQKFAKKILTAGFHAQQLVDQLMTYSSRSRRDGATDAVTLIDDMTGMLNATLRPGIDLELHMDMANAPVDIPAKRLQQVVMNLCGNAVDAIEDQTGKIFVSVARLDTQRKTVQDMFGAHRFQGQPKTRTVMTPYNGRALLTLGGLKFGANYVSVIVEDTGRGIEADDLEDIFDPFYTTHGEDGGTGLGLTVVHAIIAEHNGAAIVETGPGLGTRFEVLLPLDTGIDLPAQAAPRSSYTDEIRHGAGHVMLVEDDPVVAETLIISLERMGYAVTHHDKAMEALAALEENGRAYDLVVSDYRMPCKTGLDLARAVASQRPELPFVILSGYPADSIERTDDLPASVFAVIQKPASDAEVSAIVAEAIGKTRGGASSVDADKQISARSRIRAK